MIFGRHLVLTLWATVMVLSCEASAQQARNLSTTAGAPVVVVTITSPKPDCSTTPGSMAIPVISTKPEHGRLLLQIIVSDIAASEKCPTRKVPSVAIVYVPEKDFTGAEDVQVEMEQGNRLTSLRYRIVVKEAGQRL